MIKYIVMVYKRNGLMPIMLQDVTGIFPQREFRGMDDQGIRIERPEKLCANALYFSDDIVKIEIIPMLVQEGEDNG